MGCGNPGQGTGIPHRHRDLADPRALDSRASIRGPTVHDPDEAAERAMRCGKCRLIGERDDGLPERIGVRLGAPDGVPNLFEALGGEEGRKRAVLALVNTSTGRYEKGDHGYETDGEQSECRKDLGERQAPLFGKGAHAHVYGSIVIRPEAATVTCRVRPLTASVTV